MAEQKLEHGVSHLEEHEQSQRSVPSAAATIQRLEDGQAIRSEGLRFEAEVLNREETALAASIRATSSHGRAALQQEMQTLMQIVRDGRAVLRDAENEIHRDQLAVAGKADRDRLDAAGRALMERQFTHDRELVNGLRDRIGIAELRAIGGVREVLKHGGDAAELSAVRDEMLKTMAAAFIGARDNLDASQREKTATAAGRELNGVARCGYANVIARQAPVMAQDWRNPVALPMSPNEVRIFAGQVEGMGSLTIRVDTRKDGVHWKASTTGDTFLDSRRGLVHELTGVGTKIMFVVARPDGTTKTAADGRQLAEDSQSAKTSTAAQVAVPAPKAAGIEARLEANVEQKRLGEFRSGIEHVFERTHAVTVVAEVCLDRPMQQAPRVIEGPRHGR